MDALQFSGLIRAATERKTLPDADIKALKASYSYTPVLHILDLLSSPKDAAAREEQLHQTAARTLSRSRLYYLLEGVPELEAEWLITRTEALEGTAESQALPEPADVTEEILLEEVVEPNDFGFAFVRIKAGKKTSARSPEEGTAPQIKEDGKRKVNQQDAIIEKFLTEKPFLQPKIDFGNEGKVPDLSKKSSKLKEEIVTENMAMIYIRQKKIPQAIATLHKLTLKIPEKSAYFASLIKNLESQNPS
jgi:hypothetical protein